MRKFVMNTDPADNAHAGSGSTTCARGKGNEQDRMDRGNVEPDRRLFAGVAGLFALLRTPPEGGRPVLCLQNVTESPMHVTIGAGHLPGLDGSCRDLLTNEEYSTERGVAEVVLNPYGTCWLTT